MPGLKNLKIEIFEEFTLKKDLFENKNFTLTLNNTYGIESIINEIPSNIPIIIVADKASNDEIEDLNVQLKDIIEKHGNIKIIRK